MLQITTLQGNNSNQKCKTLSLAYVIRKYLFLSKGASSEEIWGAQLHTILFVCMHVYVCTVLSVNEYTPFEKLHFKQYLNEHKNHFQNVDKTKFNITSV